MSAWILGDTLSSKYDSGDLLLIRDMLIVSWPIMILIYLVIPAYIIDFLLNKFGYSNIVNNKFGNIIYSSKFIFLILFIFISTFIVSFLWK